MAPPPSPHASQHQRKDRRESNGGKDGVFVFAFCKENCSKPFAMSGMRHQLYQHLDSGPSAAIGGAYPATAPTADSNSDVKVAFSEHQYDTPRTSMLQRLQLAVDPLASHLNHRQRFALQHSFISQACAMHPKTVGPYKRMLRNLTTEWYQVICGGHACANQWV